MAKENKYEVMINEMNKTFLDKVMALGQETIAAMKRSELLFSPAGAQAEITRIYNEALDKCEDMRAEHVKQLNYKLQVERAKIKEGQSNYNNLTTEQKILAQLEKLNNFNSFETKIASMENEELFGIVEDKYLTENEASLLRKELTQRAKATDSSELALRARSIKSTTPLDLLESVQNTVNTFENKTQFPGLSISQALHGGYEEILGKSFLDNFNSKYYFGDGGDIE